MTLKITMAQLNPTVGDVAGNVSKALDSIAKAQHSQADIIVFPELFICGYPADDLLYRKQFLQQIDQAIEKLMQHCQNIYCLIGHPQIVGDKLYNAASMLHKGKLIGSYYKQCLPNYGVFDEQRYFSKGDKACVLNIHQTKVGIVICEDLWHTTPLKQSVEHGAELILAPNASPFSIDQDDERKTVIAKHGINTPIVYVNMVGGQDDLVFDGGSMALDQHNSVCGHADFFKESLITVSFSKDQKTGKTSFLKQTPQKPMSLESKVYQALVMGVRDYVYKNGFENIILGLSGGIDSALSLTIAVDALGPEHVTAISMPSRYTSDLSNNAAKQQADKLGVSYKLYSIESMFNTFAKTLAPELKGPGEQIAMQNCQARCRGIILMSIANAQNALVLSTGNRSELAMGYATLYGDMAGAFCALKDVPKTLVYQLAKFRNQAEEIIPNEVILREPTAELAPDQKDEDNLPPYPVLDAILEAYINDELDLKEIMAKYDFPEAVVKRVIKQLHINEYKRAQSAPGVRINPKAFGRDRRYPITSRYQDS